MIKRFVCQHPDPETRLRLQRELHRAQVSIIIKESRARNEGLEISFVFWHLASDSFLFTQLFRSRGLSCTVRPTTKLENVPSLFPSAVLSPAGERITIRRLEIAEQRGQPAREEQFANSRNVSLNSQSENGEKRT
jgi:hypothetical protein